MCVCVDVYVVFIIMESYLINNIIWEYGVLGNVSIGKGVKYSMKITYNREGRNNICMFKIDEYILEKVEKKYYL